MLRLFMILIVLIFSLGTFGQTNCCLTDTISTGGQILQRLKADGIAGLIVTNKNSGKKYQGYRVCEHHYLQIDSLNEILTYSQVDSLLNCENGTLKTTAFILFAKRHNNKDSVIKKLKEILNQEYIVMTTSCSDAIQTTSLGKLNYDLLIKPNSLFKPSFRLTKQDQALIELDLAYYELLMKSN
ncbi:hypothetical protein [Lacibacter sp. H407]|uniref:hypothetical protein n=1 Tax=Lacibacter sp. H407 TaxID=3133423 RepID=UPI0030C53078